MIHSTPVLNRNLQGTRHAYRLQCQSARLTDVQSKRILNRSDGTPSQSSTRTCCSEAHPYGKYPSCSVRLTGHDPKNLKDQRAEFCAETCSLCSYKEIILSYRNKDS